MDFLTFIVNKIGQIGITLLLLVVFPVLIVILITRRLVISITDKIKISLNEGKNV